MSRTSAKYSDFVKINKARERRLVLEAVQRYRIRARVPKVTPMTSVVLSSKEPLYKAALMEELGFTYGKKNQIRAFTISLIDPVLSSPDFRTDSVSRHIWRLLADTLWGDNE